MIQIDGSVGGGQILRTAVGLSALTLKPCKISNIRKKRPNPGLKNQHLWGVKIAGEICGANIKGLEVGSEQVEFIPKEHRYLNKEVDIGTSGSLQLLLQSLAPVFTFSNKDIEIKATGGTAGLGSPTAEYTKFVTFPIIGMMTEGRRPYLEIQRQGFYPKGGGRIKAKFYPTKHLKALDITKRRHFKKISGISVAGKLAEDVARRQAISAKEMLANKGYDADIKVEKADTFSPGTSITLFAEYGNTLLGADEIGKIRKRAEKVGKEAAESLSDSIESDAALDKYMSDQIIPFIALAKGKSRLKVEEITEHTRANIMVTQELLGVEFEVDEDKKIVSVKGDSFTLQ